MRERLVPIRLKCTPINNFQKIMNMKSVSDVVVMLHRNVAVVAEADANAQANSDEEVLAGESDVEEAPILNIDAPHEGNPR